MTGYRPDRTLRHRAVSPPEPVSTDTSQLLEHSAPYRGWTEQDRGPYHRDIERVRRDIAGDRPGAPLPLGIRLTSSDVRPLLSVAMDIWHCDALGRYSGFPPPDPAVVVTAATAPKAHYLPGATFLPTFRRSDEPLSANIAATASRSRRRKAAPSAG